MGDCQNVEMRELLPERAAELLSPRDAARVDGHVAECELCTFELEILRAARTALRGRATVDVGRISGAVVLATRTPVRSVRRAPTRQWIGWRAAASIALVAVGATSIAVWNGGRSGARGSVATTPGTETAAVATPSGAGTLAQGAATGSGSVSSSGSAQATVRPASLSGLTAAGGLSDLSDAELESLLGDIGSLDASSFDEPQEVMPAIGASEGVQ
ncbi:MAG TPA: zf-HC2 domain-containing protein [Gemmatimonadaceae bacterium]|nr:zf-HC2 domain-containing protein [Gemmatimonadaceae bacterium]